MFAVFVVLSVMVVTIVLHEAGHLLAARFFGMSVSTFSIGLGPKIFGFRTGSGRMREIEWIVRALPLGGYVRIHGMFEGMQGQERTLLLSEGRTEDESAMLLAADRLYCNQPGYNQAIVMSAGVCVNLACSMGTLTLTLWLLGAPQPVDKVDTDSPTSVGVHLPHEGAEVGTQPITLAKATGLACSMVKEASVDMLVALQRPVENVSSPIQMVEQTNRIVQRKLHPGFIWVMTFAALNCAIALFNILPIPALDGGHLVCAIFKGIGMPVPFVVQVVSSTACILLLSGLMGYGLIRDVIALLW